MHGTNVKIIILVDFHPHCSFCFKECSFFLLIDSPQVLIKLHTNNILVTEQYGFRKEISNCRCSLQINRECIQIY